MEELLFLCHRIPYPPNKGDKVRAFHWLQGFARHYRVHLGTFVDDPADWAWRGVLNDLCAEQCYRPLRSHAARLRSLPGFFSGAPLSFPYYQDGVLRRWVERVMRSRPIQAIVVFSGAMAPYAAPYPNVRRILDFVDVDSEKWRQYAATASGPMRWVYAREGQKLLQAERSLAAAFDTSVFVSRAEAALFSRRAPESAGRVASVANGVDTAYFDPARLYPDPYAGRGSQTLVFTGALDYPANINAVAWFVKEVLPSIQRERSRVRFDIVGARPGAAVKALGRVGGVRVTGDVDDIRPYLAHAGAAVAPLRIARGLQNKVLEALAMNKPVLLTPQAAEGLEPLPRRVTEMATQAQALAALALRSLDKASHSSGTAARDYVLVNYDWSRQFGRLLSLVTGDSTSSEGAALSPPSPSRREVLA